MKFKVKKPETKGGKRTNIRIFTILAAFILVILFAGTVSATTWTVCSSGCNYTTISSAINAASSSDTILVYSGTYNEKVTVNKQLVLRGVDNGGGKPIVNAGGSGNAITLTVNGITLDGFNVTGGNTGIYVTSSSNNIFVNNTIQSNNGANSITNGVNGGNGIGIYFGSSSSDTFANNTIQSNNGGSVHSGLGSGGYGVGIYLGSSSSDTFADNTIQSNNGGSVNAATGSGGNGYGIYFVSSSINNSFANNTIKNNNGGSTNALSSSNGGIGAGIYLTSTSSNNSFANNIIQSNNGGSVKLPPYGGNGYGIYFVSSSINNYFANNTIQNNNGGSVSSYSGNGYGIYLGSSSIKNFFANNIIQSNNGLGAVTYGGYGYGIYLSSASNNNTFANNIIQKNNGMKSGASNSGWGIYLTSSINNLIYNNNLNNTINVFESATPNIWNTTKTAGINIVGGGYLGGNYWAVPNGTGFSQTCTDANSDGICDSNYNIPGGGIDYLPLVISAPPASITNLHNISYAPNYINWTWADPTDPSFSNVTVYLNGVFQKNVSKGAKYFNATGLQPGTQYTISTQTVGNTGLVNQTWVNDTETTTPDTTPPASITNLHNVSYAPDYIVWAWSDPADADFDHVMVYIDGSFITNISKGVQSCNATGLALDTPYTISTHTVDTSGNVNLTWVNDTVMTDSPPPSTASITTDGDGKYTSAPLDLGKNVTFTSIQLSGTGKINQARVYTAYRAAGTPWSTWAQAKKSSDGYTVASGQYGRYFGYVIIAPAGVVVTKSTIDYVVSPDGVIEIK